MRLEEIYRAYGNHADFYVVYIREAHPTDGWALGSNRDDGVLYAQPRTADARAEAARACSVGLRLTMPVLLDDMANTVALQYNAWPERLYVLACDGTVAYKGGKGPYGFDPEELAKFLAEQAA